ncbi:hypothetical protein pb186bvf_021096 [Paramecium bursaria]
MQYYQLFYPYYVLQQYVNLKSKELISNRRLEEPIGLTQLPSMSRSLFKTNIKYLHEITRLMHVKYIHLSLIARFMLTQTNINVLLTSLHIFDVLINSYILSVVISILAQLTFQIMYQSYLDISLQQQQTQDQQQSTLFLIGIHYKISNRTDQEHFIQIIQIYNRLSFAFTVSEQLRVEPFNPLINFIYYFFQDEIGQHCIDHQYILQYILILVRSSNLILIIIFLQVLAKDLEVRIEMINCTLVLQTLYIEIDFFQRVISGITYKKFQLSQLIQIHVNFYKFTYYKIRKNALDNIEIKNASKLLILDFNIFRISIGFYSIKQFRGCNKCLIDKQENIFKKSQTNNIPNIIQDNREYKYQTKSKKIIKPYAHIQLEDTQRNLQGVKINLYILNMDYVNLFKRNQMYQNSFRNQDHLGNLHHQFIYSMNLGLHYNIAKELQNIIYLTQFLFRQIYLLYVQQLPFNIKLKINLEIITQFESDMTKIMQMNIRTCSQAKKNYHFYLIVLIGLTYNKIVKMII